jgi:RNA polymerase subunit RPABC4/transcription elongation factor Spt4
MASDFLECGLLALLGVGVFIAGRRLIRKRGQLVIGGSDPHCKNCNYLLLHLQSDRCPECGTLLTEKNIVHGERSNGIGGLIIGTITILVSLRMMIPLPVAIFESIPWYHFKRAPWVLADLQTGTLAIRDKALQELERRYDRGSLPHDILNQAIEYALNQQAATIPTRLTSQCVDYLGRHWAAGEMTDAQKQRFFRQLVRVTLIAHPQIAAGDAVSCIQIFTFASPQAAGSKDLWLTVYNIPTATIDAVPAKVAKAGGGPVNGVGSTGRFELTMPAQSVGTHNIQISQPINVYEGKFPTERTLLYHEDRKLQTSIAVLANPPANLIQLDNNPKLAATLRACLQLKRLEYYRQSEHSFRVTANFEFDNLPASVAFDVIARSNGKEYPLDPLEVLQGGSGGQGRSGDVPLDSLPAACDLILRADPKIACETGDMNEIWNGQIVLTNVPLVPAKQ